MLSFGFLVVNQKCEVSRSPKCRDSQKLALSTSILKPTLSHRVGVFADRQIPLYRGKVEK
jgi:hypothetical protein